MLRQTNIIGISWKVLEYPCSNITSMLDWYFIGIVLHKKKESNVHFKRFLQGCSHIPKLRRPQNWPVSTQLHLRARHRHGSGRRFPLKTCSEWQIWIGKHGLKSPNFWGVPPNLSFNHVNIKSCLRLLDLHHGLRSDFQPLSRTSIDSAPVPFGTAIVPSSSAEILCCCWRPSRSQMSQRNLVGSHRFGLIQLEKHDLHWFTLIYNIFVVAIPQESSPKKQKATMFMSHCIAWNTEKN